MRRLRPVLKACHTRNEAVRALALISDNLPQPGLSRTPKEFEMALTLNHFSIRSTDLDACERFYVGVLGLTVGPRPDFPFPGLWIYRGDHADPANAVVHIIGKGGPDGAPRQGSGAVDHIAFFADGLAAMRAHLEAQGVAYRHRVVPALGLQQVFVTDPCGVLIELNYPASEAA